MEIKTAITLQTGHQMKEQTIDKCESIITGIRTIQEKLTKIDAEIKTLEETGTIYAGSWMKDGWYMYLVYPAKRGEKRIRKYIGADKKKQKEAIEKIKRGHKANYLKRLRDEIEHRLEVIENAVIHT